MDNNRLTGANGCKLCKTGAIVFESPVNSITIAEDGTMISAIGNYFSDDNTNHSDLGYINEAIGSNLNITFRRPIKSITISIGSVIAYFA